jgi:hypothetical protein
MSLGAQNIKTESETLGTAENQSRRAKRENEIGRPQYRRKRVRERKTFKREPTASIPPKTIPGAQNMKTGIDALGTAENDSSSAKHENGTRRTRHRQQ